MSSNARNMNHSFDGAGLDILFIVPPYTRFMGMHSYGFPLGIGYIVAYLQQHQIRSQIYHADLDQPHFHNIFHRLWNTFYKNRYLWYNFSKKFFDFYTVIQQANHPLWEEVRIVLKRTHPKIIGISSKIIDIPSTLMLCHIAKILLPHVKIIIGGPSATTVSDELIKHECVDFLVFGEGEKTILELSQHLLHRTASSDVSKIQGIWYKDHERVIRTEPRPLIQDLDALPFPDRDAMFVVNKLGEIQYVHENKDILTTRGCPYPCKFCACYQVWGTRKPRSRGVQNIIDELLYLNTTYHQENFIFWDDLFAVDRNRVIALCEKIIANHLKISWICFLRINTIDAELLAILKQAGCVEIQIGIESGNNRILKYIGKQITVEQIREKMPIIQQSGLRWLAFFIIGFPTETHAEIQQTLHLIAEIQPTSVCISVFSPYPGTEFFDELHVQELLGKQYLQVDTFNVHYNFTSTMSDADFQVIALQALKFGDAYNAQKSRIPLTKKIYRYLKKRLPVKLKE